MKKTTQFSVLGMHLATRGETSTIYFHNSPRYWIRAMDFVPYFWNERDGEKTSTQVKPLYFTSKLDAAAIVATLNQGYLVFGFSYISFHKC